MLQRMGLVYTKRGFRIALIEVAVFAMLSNEHFEKGLKIPCPGFHGPEVRKGRFSRSSAPICG
jgi:hypothetical protein